MTHYEINPLTDPRWRVFVDGHPCSSAFHTPQWLEALLRTYGYIPSVLTSTPAGEPLTNGIVLCQVDSWLTGSRCVSLPFSDHCEPLIQNSDDLAILLSGLLQKAGGAPKYAEVRARGAESMDTAGFQLYVEHCFHVLNLRPGIEELYSGLHKDSVQRKIKRAAREGLEREHGRSELLLKEFYMLLLLTRRRHGLPPQPFRWFRNLVDGFGPRLTIHVARHAGRPIASILTLKHRSTVVYKYGCSDARFHQMGAMPCLFWEAIQQAKSEEMLELDLGRSEFSNAGLIRFKDHLGAARTTLKYWRSFHRPSDQKVTRPHIRMAKKILTGLPDPLFRLAGEVFYRHAG